MSKGRVEARGLLVAALGAAMLSACSGGVPRATNPAVEACARLAEKQGLEVLDQQAVTPLQEGRYRVELAARDKKGDRRVVCAFDPSSGASIAEDR